MLEAVLLLVLQEVTLVTLDGETVRASDVRASLQGDHTVITATVAGASREFRADGLVEIVADARPVPRPILPGIVRVTTTAGDVLWGRVADPEGEELRLESTLGEDLVLPIERIASVVVAANERSLPEDASADSTADRVYRRNGDVDSGSVLSLRTDGVEYHSERFNRTITIPYHDLAGAYIAALVDPPATPAGVVAGVSFRDSSRLVGLLSEMNADAVAVRDFYGVVHQLPRAELHSIFFLGGRVVYLSDLDPSRVDENANYIRLDTPSAGDLVVPWRRDRSARGTPLRIGGTEHRKGIGVHAYSALTFTLDGAYERFEAVVGVDDSARGIGEVRFRVVVDGREDDLGVMTSRDGARLVRVDVHGAREIQIIADFGSRGGAGAYGDWASARLIRPAP